MKNLLAFVFVSLFLAACAGYTYQNTHAAQQTLMRDMPASSWDRYVREGGAFHGR